MLRPTLLRCEYHVNPLAVDEPQPRLSWVDEPLDPAAKGLNQAAWRVIAASSEDRLARGEADLWDTGVVEGPQTNGIVYNGRDLKAFDNCWWKVAVWHDPTAAPTWSAPACWSMGVLDGSQWPAKWIAEPEADTFEGCKWVWHGQPAAEGWFWGAIHGPEEAVEAARLLLASDAALDVFVNGRAVGWFPGGAGRWRHPVTIDLCSHLLPNTVNSIAIRARGSDGPNAVSGRIIMRLGGGEQRLYWLDNAWKASGVEPAGWPKPTVDDAADAVVICRVGETDSMAVRRHPWGIPGTDEPVLLTPPTILSKRFTPRGKVKRARLYAAALGNIEARIDGTLVSEEYFAPGWCDYRKRAYYRCWDATELLQADGEKALELTLADGWYAGHLAWGRRRNLYNGVARASAFLLIEYTAGGTEIIPTDETWVARDSVIRHADLLMGEAHDLRHDGGRGVPVCWMDPPTIAFSAHPGPPVRATETLKPKTVLEQAPGIYVLDMGQNMVGTVRLRATGRAGHPIRLRFAEALNADGSVYTTSLRGAMATDIVVPATDGPVEFSPRLTFHGFRYVELSGCAEPPTIDAVEGLVLHSDIRRTGWFQCSDPGVNKLMQNILWGMRGNYVEVPTDCPQRDERLGWTGDAQAFIGTASYLMDVAPFMTKWMVDVEDGQHPDGAFTHVAPDIGIGGGSAGWGDAGVICPWRVYTTYGDERILRRHYPAMRRWIDYLRRNSKDLVRPEDGFGDWLSLNAYTPKSLIGTAFFAHAIALTAKVARVLGDDAGATELGQLHGEVVAAFQKRFLLGNGTDARLNDVGILEGNTQTSNTLALQFGLMPDHAVSAAAFHLVRDLHIRAYHLSTGFLGLPHLLPVLTRIGRTDLAYRLLLNEDFPSWLYQIRLGATTMWERWDGWSEEFGFQNPEMNSFNHYAYGAVGEWLFATVAGIDISELHARRIVFAPIPGGGMTRASACVETTHGSATIEWRLVNARELFVKVRVPANVGAEVRIPCSEGEQVEAPGTAVDLGWRNGARRFTIAQGLHEFRRI